MGVLSAVCPAQDTAEWFARTGAAGARITGAAALSFTGLTSNPQTTGPGDYEVHFGFDAKGKPESLAISVPAGSTVRLGVDPASAVRPLEVGSQAPADYRFAAVATMAGASGSFGLVARKRDEDNWYRLVCDADSNEFRLERSVGGVQMVIGSAPAPAFDDAAHDVSLQVDGFRLRAWFDDALVVQALDGAQDRGGWATWPDGESGVRWRAAAVEPVAMMRASSAVVGEDRQATLFVSTAAAGGHYGVLELSLDWPYPALPRTAAGLEPWLLQRPAAPRVMLGDFLGEVGRGSIAQLPVDGRMQCGLRWPRGAAFFGQAVLARVLVVSPDGERLVSRTPAVAVVM